MQALTRFPTLAVGVGDFESIGDLRYAARPPFTRSAGAIKVVVLVKYEHRADPLQLPADSFVGVWKIGARGTPRRSVRRASVISRILVSTNALATSFSPLPADPATHSTTLNTDELFGGHRPAASIRGRLQARVRNLRKASERNTLRMRLPG